MVLSQEWIYRPQRVVSETRWLMERKRMTSLPCNFLTNDTSKEGKVPNVTQAISEIIPVCFILYVKMHVRLKLLLSPKPWRFNIFVSCRCLEPLLTYQITHVDVSLPVEHFFPPLYSKMINTDNIQRSGQRCHFSKCHTLTPTGDIWYCSLVDTST